MRRDARGAAFCATTADVATLARLADEALAAGAASLLVLLAEVGGTDPGELARFLAAQSVPVLGGVFPRIVHGAESFDRGALVVALPPIQTARIEDLDKDGLAARIAAAVEPLAGARTVLTLVDGHAGRITAAMDHLYDVLGADVGYLGGGAGSLDVERMPCLFDNRGVFGGGMLLAGLDISCETAVEHGWTKLAGPFVVTEARDNVITAINYRPALEVWREVVEADSGRVLDDEGFLDLAASYPFGMEHADGSTLVRAPLGRRGKALVCVGEIPAYGLVNILRGDPDMLVGSAARCAQTLARRLSDRPALGPVLVFDCISRALFLGERFEEELVAVRSGLPGQLGVAGALSLGEIANPTGNCLEFHNKTMVLGGLTREPA